MAQVQLTMTPVRRSPHSRRSGRDHLDHRRDVPGAAAFTFTSLYIGPLPHHDDEGCLLSDHEFRQGRCSTSQPG